MLQIFHVNVRIISASSDTELQRLDILWVRGLVVEATAPGGFAAKQLTRVAFVPDNVESDLGQYAFLDPADVIRGAHIIPAFAHGRISSVPPVGPLGSMNVKADRHERDAANKVEYDFRYYYINMYVARLGLKCRLG